MMLFQTDFHKTGTLNPEQMQVLTREVSSRTYRKHMVWLITEAISQGLTCPGDEVFARKQKRPKRSHQLRRCPEDSPPQRL